MSEKIPYSDFEKLDLRVGKIISVGEHSNADKLYVLEVDFGELGKRTIVAGLKKHYEKKDLIEKKAVFAVNLEPVKLRGVESNGMILAAVNGEEKVIYIAPEGDIEEGAKIR